MRVLTVMCALVLMSGATFALAGTASDTNMVMGVVC